MSKNNRNIRKTSFSEMYCTFCGCRNFSIPRQAGKERPAGHLKKLFCLKCGCERNHVECKPWTKYDYNDFLIEFENDNFDTEGNRILPYGELKNKLHNKQKEK